MIKVNKENRICTQCGNSNAVTNCDKCNRRTCRDCATIKGMDILHNNCYRRKKR